MSNILLRLNIQQYGYMQREQDFYDRSILIPSDDVAHGYGGPVQIPGDRALNDSTSAYITFLPTHSICQIYDGNIKVSL
jgi:hypothetical protein